MNDTRRLSLKRDTLAELTPVQLGGIGGAAPEESTFTPQIITRKLTEVPTWDVCPLSGAYATLPVATCVQIEG